MRRIERYVPAPLVASISLAFALMGDAFLYSFLPTNALSVQLPVVWIGAVLSINRFTRIALNPLILYVLNCIGFRSATIIAASTAVLTTIGYGLGPGVLVWLLLRVLWGLSFSVLRTASLTYALDAPRKGFALGLTYGITECGPVIALLIGPVILAQTSPAHTFALLGCLSLPGIYFAFRLPERASTTPRPPTFRLTLPSLVNGLTFVSAFAVEGLVIVLVGVLLSQSQPTWTRLDITTVAAGFLSFRRVCSLFMAPSAGWLADVAGLSRVYAGSLLLIGIGFVLIATGYVLTGLVIIFGFYSVNAALATGGAVDTNTDASHGVSRNAIYRDAGAAFGALAAGLLLPFPRLDLVFVASSLVLASLLSGYWYQHRAMPTLRRP